MAEEVSSHRFFRRLVSVVEGEVVPDPSVTVFRSAASVVAAVVVDVVDRE